MQTRSAARLATLAFVASCIAGMAASAVGAELAGTQPVAAPTARIVPIVRTAPPGGSFGYWGFDVFDRQSAAARFAVPAGADHRLVRIGLWLMNNSDVHQAALRLSVQTDALDEGGDATQPSGRVLATWTTTVQALGWNPVEQFFVATRSRFPLLKAGANYWVVAESSAPALLNPVWPVASRGTLVTTITNDGVWQPAGEGAALTLRVDAAPVEP